jgi:chromate transporter
MILFWELFYTFFLIGLLNFGGGGAMVSLIQSQVVMLHGWLSEGAFTDIVGISQSTPGPVAINCATYVGYEVIHTAGYGVGLSILGSFLSTLAVVLPSFLVFLVVIRIFNKYHSSRAYAYAMNGLRPVVVGLIAAAATVLTIHVHPVSIIEENFPDWTAWALFAAALILSQTKKLGPIAIILSAGAIGLFIY